MLSGPINSAETTTTFPQRLCEDGLSVEVTREQRYGLSRLGADDDDDDDDDDWQRQRLGADVAASLRLSSLRRQPPQPRAVAETQLHGGGGGGCGGAPRLGRVHARLPAARPGPSPAAGRALLAVSASATAVAAFIPARDDVVSAAAAIEQRGHVT